jgi:hypothetical protein
MLRRRGGVAAAGLALVFLLLAGCAVVDKYADRAVDYNLQAEKTQQQNLLLNIIRASLRRPMQFTGLTSITGTASASGTLGGGYTSTHQTPVVQDLGANIPSTLGGISSTAIGRVITGTGTASGTMSGGPTFTVPVLDTQEFYQGILTPVSPQIIDYYVQQGFPPEVLFDLFVARVEMIVTDGPSCERFMFRNDVRNELRFAQFQALADYLIVSGFTTERVADRIAYGPALRSNVHNLNPTETAKVIEAYSKASAAGLDIQAENGSLRMTRRSSHYRFCFAVNADERPTWLGIPPDAYCGNEALRRPTAVAIKQSQKKGTYRASHCPPVAGAQGSGDAGTGQFHGILLSRAFLDRIARLQHEARMNNRLPSEDEFPIRAFVNKHVTFKFQTRSVEAILYYLGEITRQHLRPEFGGDPRISQVKTGLRFGAFPNLDCDSRRNGETASTHSELTMLGRIRRHENLQYTCENLFVLDQGAISNTIYSVIYDGTIYSVPTDPARAGRSLQVLELVKQLLALNTSAKQLPSTGILSIIGGTAQ